MTRKVKEGDLVRLKRDSRFWDQSMGNLGTGDDGWFEVTWGGVGPYGYQNEDVEVIHIANKLNRKLYPSYIEKNGFLEPPSLGES